MKLVLNDFNKKIPKYICDIIIKITKHLTSYVNVKQTFKVKKLSAGTRETDLSIFNGGSVVDS